MPYRLAEECQILKYIIDNDGYGLLRGRAFWQMAEDESGVQRTWQSMKEHFLKKMLQRIYEDRCYVLTAEQKMHFMKHLHSKVVSN